MGEDVAIPHARIAGLRRPLVALGVGRAGIQDRESGRSVRIMLLLLSPADPPESHVEMLGVISRMARDDQWRKEVLSARKSSDVMGAIRAVGRSPQRDRPMRRGAGYDVKCAVLGGHCSARQQGFRHSFKMLTFC